MFIQAGVVIENMVNQYRLVLSVLPKGEKKTEIMKLYRKFEEQWFFINQAIKGENK